MTTNEARDIVSASKYAACTIPAATVRFAKGVLIARTRTVR